MGGWLFPEDTNVKKSSSKQLSMDTLFNMGCKACPLDRVKNLRHPKMDATGSEHPLVYILGEGPGNEEDKTGLQFVGRSGNLLRKYLPKWLIKKIRWNNSINCQPPDNRNPSAAELTCCRPRLIKDIETTKPKAIFGFGGIALKWAIGEERISSWRGIKVPIKIGKHTCWFYPFNHPSYLLRLGGSSAKAKKIIVGEQELFFERDLKRAIKEVKRLPDARIVEGDEITEGIEIIDSSKGWAHVKRIRTKLKKYSKLKEVAFDYETASDERVKEKKFRPHGKNTRILTISVGTKDDTIAFPIAHRENKWSKSQLRAVIEAWLIFLKSRTRKIAHNLFFELEWTTYFFDINRIRCCKWHDTMAQAYVLGYPSGTTNLNALILIHFGFRLKDILGITLNMSDLDREPLDKVLPYNALDVKWTHALFCMQEKTLRDQDRIDIYEEQVNHIPTMVLKSHFGMLIDFDALLEFDKNYGPRIIKLENWFQKSKEVAKFEKRIGRKFKPTSPLDVLTMFRNVLGRKECKVGEDEKGKSTYSTKDEVLEKIPLKFAKKIQEYRAVTGNKSKYVNSLIPKGYVSKEVTKKKEVGICVWSDGLTHAQIKTLIIVSRRTSCTFPNEQFWPKRDEEYADLRKLFTAPTKGLRQRMKAKYDYELPSWMNNDDCWFVSIDYGQMQARIAGMLSSDPIYCKYLWDRNDLHMRWTKKLARAYPRRIGGEKFLKDKDALKKFRTDVKNQWTFPLIFGATANSVSGYLHIPVDILRDMIKQFFREMPGLKNYQNRMCSFYEKNGYIETPEGFRRYGPINYGEIINTPIQGGEAEIVLNAMDRLSEAAQELDYWQFQARLEIHDELGFWIPKKTSDRDIEFITDYMLECSHMPWITVPLCIEISKGPNWFDLEDVSTLYSDDLGKLNREACGF